MSDERCCCNCLHCARWRKAEGIECHCDLDDKYLGYLKVMDTESDCEKWEHETKWYIQEAHDKEIYNKAIDDFMAFSYLHGIDFSFGGKIKEDGTSDVPERLEKIKEKFYGTMEKLKEGGKNEEN